jgi:putative pyruvate formate lyase activating enzyme
LRSRVDKAKELLDGCCLCPQKCGINRLDGKSGECHITKKVIISSYGPHFGEEAPLVGRYGSGTIFFAYCNLHCRFCQNYTISQLGEGNEVDEKELAGIMLSLQGRGCHNINLVSPTHVVPHILSAVELAVSRGLNLPLIYNSGGYDSVETLKLLDGIIDIYMPDMKYSDERIAEQLSGVMNYPRVNKAAVMEMHRQVGNLRVDKQGVAQQGLLVRHLVLPNRLAGTREIVHFLAQKVSTKTYLNIMAQYQPCYKAFNMPQLARSVNKEEFYEAFELAHQQGLYQFNRYELPFPLRPIRR